MPSFYIVYSFKLSGDEDRHKISDDFDFGLDRFGVTLHLSDNNFSH